MLAKEYGTQYREGRSIAEAQKAMETVNPHLAPFLPAVALELLKSQFAAYVAKDSPFDRRRSPLENAIEWWSRLLLEPSAHILAVCHFNCIVLTGLYTTNFLGASSKDICSSAYFNG